MATTKLTGTLIKSGSIPVTALGGGVVSSSVQLATSLPAGTISSSAQYPGWVTSSGQIDYNSIQNKLSGVVSSSAQVAPLLPGGTVSSSAQYPGWVTSSGQISITATAGYSTFSSSIATKNDTHDISINALNAATSSYAINSTIQSQLAGVASSSTQVKAYLPGGTVTSSAQYPGWVTSSTQIDYNSIQNKLSGVISSSTQFNALTGTSASFAATASFVNTLNQNISASGNIEAGNNLRSNFSSGDEGGEINLARPQTNSSISGSINIDVYQNKLRIFEAASPNRGGYYDITALASGVGTNLAGGGGTVTSVTAGDGLSGGTITGTGTIIINTGSAHFITGSVSASGLIGTVTSSAQVKILLPNGIVSSSAQYPGWVTASSQIDYNSIQNKLSGVVSSSTQVQPLLPAGTVSSSAQYPGWVTASSQIDYNSIQNKLSGVVSSSAQVAPLLPAGTISSSGQVVVQNTTGIAAIATTGSNVFAANQTITGSLFISQNLVVQGSSSISYISQSTLNIGTNKITVNTDSPSIRFGGLDVIDSGSSPQRSGSIYFDSLNDQWIFVHQNTAGGITSSVIVMGPPTFNNIGNETLFTQNRVLKSNGLEHITDSQISDNGVTVSITNGLSVGTNVSASGVNVSGLNASQIVSTDANKNLSSTATTGTGNVVLAGSPTLTGTLSAANITANGTLLLQNIVSQSSAPTFTGLTSTGTVLLQGIVSQSSQIDYNQIQNKLSGVISSSTQFNALTGTSASFAATSSFAVNAANGVTINSNVDNYLVTATGTTGTLQGESNLTFDGTNLSTTGVLSTGTVRAPTLYSRGAAASAGNILIQSDNGSSTAFWITAKTGGASLHIGGNGGTEPTAGAVVIDTNYNVGIGTSSPSYKLDLIGRARLRSDGVSSAGHWLTNNTGTTDVFTGLVGVSSTDSWGVYSQGDWRLIVNNGGDIGIGTTLPAAKLDVRGSVYTTNTYWGYPTQLVGNLGRGGSGLADLQIVQAGGAFRVINSAYNSSLFVVNDIGTFYSSGSATIANSIGTGDAYLDIGQGRNANGYAYVDLVGDTTYTDYGTRLIRNNTGANASSFLSHRGTGELGIFTQEAAPITFHTSATEKVRIDSSGNVGIGTTSNFDSAKLDVRSGKIVAGTNTSTNGSVTIQNYYTDGALSLWGSMYSSGGPLMGYGVKSSTTTANSFLSATGINISRGAYIIEGHIHRWYNGAVQTVAVDGAVTMTERMTMDANGNVGIGTTSPATTLHVQGNTSASSAQFTGIVSGSGTSYRLVVPVGTNFYAT